MARLNWDRVRIEAREVRRGVQWTAREDDKAPPARLPASSTHWIVTGDSATCPACRAVVPRTRANRHRRRCQKWKALVAAALWPPAS